MDFKYRGNENVDWIDIEQDENHRAFVKQAARRESYAPCNNSGTFIHACVIVSKRRRRRRRRRGGRRRRRRRRRRRVLDIKRVSFFLQFLFQMISLWYLVIYVRVEAPAKARASLHLN